MPNLLIHVIVNETVLEQILAPILKVHEANGTAVFDILGGSAAVKPLQNPDEILVFAVVREYARVTPRSDVAAETLKSLFRLKTNVFYRMLAQACVWRPTSSSSTRVTITAQTSVRELRQTA